jgi:hypothetical protein
MIARTPVATSSQNPSNLPPRYEIRQLTAEHSDWAKAIVLHSNMFHSPVWPVIYPEHKAARLFGGWDAGDYLVKHQISSGMSFGVFDTEYKYKRPESEATNGKLYWDELKDNPDATSEELLERMDFPLASVALAYDGINPLDMAQIMPMIEVLPLFGTLYHVLETQDPRGESWKPTEANQILLRNATSTRNDYEGQHLMGNLARFLMREAKLKGFKGIQIEGAHDAVNHVWLHPPAPFKGELITMVDMATYEQEGEDGKKVLIFAPSKQSCTKMYVTL